MSVAGHGGLGCRGGRIGPSGILFYYCIPKGHTVIHALGYTILYDKEREIFHEIR